MHLIAKALADLCRYDILFHSNGIIGSDFQTQVEAQTPLGRIGQPDDITPIAVFLASTDSGWLTGETVLASGGLR